MLILQQSIWTFLLICFSTALTDALRLDNRNLIHRVLHSNNAPCRGPGWLNPESPDLKGYESQMTLGKRQAVNNTTTANSPVVSSTPRTVISSSTAANGAVVPLVLPGNPPAVAAATTTIATSSTNAAAAAVDTATSSATSNGGSSIVATSNAAAATGTSSSNVATSGSLPSAGNGAAIVGSPTIITVGSASRATGVLTGVPAQNIITLQSATGPSSVVTSVATLAPTTFTSSVQTVITLSGQRITTSVASVVTQSASTFTTSSMAGEAVVAVISSTVADVITTAADGSPITIRTTVPFVVTVPAAAAASLQSVNAAVTTPFASVAGTLLFSNSPTGTPAVPETSTQLVLVTGADGVRSTITNKIVVWRVSATASSTGTAAPARLQSGATSTLEFNLVLKFLFIVTLLAVAGFIVL